MAKLTVGDIRKAIEGMDDSDPVTLDVGDPGDSNFQIDGVGNYGGTLCISISDSYDEDYDNEEYEEDDEEEDEHQEDEYGYTPTGYTPTAQDLTDEQAIVSDLVARGFTPDTPSDDTPASIYRLQIDRLYEFYIEPWDRRYCAKYNMMVDCGDEDLEWDTAAPVFQWLRDNPEVRSK